MAKKSKKKKQEEEIPEAWLLPYSDLLTLLLALFIVLFAMSSIDAQKMQQLSSVFNEVFDGGQGVMDNPSPVDTTTPKSQKEPSAAYVEDQKALGQIKSDMDNFIAVNELEDQFATKLTDDGVLISIRDSVLFKQGSADVSQKNKDKVLKELSKLLQFDPPRHIVIAGYTDNVPMSGGEYSSNWELSVMRSVNFLTELMSTNSKLDPAYFSAKGYGENMPVASNKTEKGRAKNRRVEVLIQPLVKQDGTAATTDTTVEKQKVEDIKKD